jgi:hypothetical protein
MINFYLSEDKIMGWDFCEAWESREDVRDMLVRSFTEGGSKVLAHAFAWEKGETCLWMAIDHPKEGRLVFLALVSCKGVGGVGGPFGYKDMDEGMGPYFYKVPAAVWAEVKDTPPPNSTAAEWRKKVQPV